ncbi:DNA-formamidopyrimidine glycosylase family protein [Enemella sp. A6]|uniref:DNA-formamidopyrimidine glycosylase family protein n=1 Tax=Enemella sp. A6 TaxID=3440152 RepID=UPI003EB75BB5
MPEGDTVKRTALRLHRVFAGRLLTRCELRWPSVAEYDFTGATTIEVASYGKHLLHRLTLDDRAWTVHSHLRMEGSWIIDRPGARAGGHKVRALLGTDEYLAIGHNLGMLDVVPTAEEHTLIGHLGPDLLGENWNAEVAVHNLQQHPDTIAAALLDQRCLAGIGTIWAAETLFAERLDPWTPAADLSEAQLLSLVNRAQRFLQASCAHAIPSSTGDLRPGRNTYVHGRHRNTCRRCGTPIRVEMAGPPTRERTIFYCPSCQSVGSRTG